MRRRVTALTVEEIDPLWSTGRKPFKSGLEIYTHVIRAEDDPEEKPRGKDGRTTTSWKELKKIPVWKWTSLIASHLADEVPRTFNRICVELTGYTADVCFQENPDTALWQLVEEEVIEHSLEAPILFRIVPQLGDTVHACPVCGAKVGALCGGTGIHARRVTDFPEERAILRRMMDLEQRRVRLPKE